jgi:RNA polymerase sigma-70 factor, ECF subfamily
MNPTTSHTLIQRLVAAPDTPSQEAAWARFIYLYTPVLLAWARNQGLQDADATDFVQEVLVRLAINLTHYKRVEGHSFRGWLFTLVRNLYRDFCNTRRNRPLPGPAGLSGVEGLAAADAIAEMDEHEYRLRLTRQALEGIRGQFQETTWEAFRRLAVEGLPVAEVTSALGITDDAAHAARRRVLERLREELEGFLE